MNFVTAVHTDIGIKKKTNQDSMLLLEANTDDGPVLFAAVCDGMGGLSKGEVASAALIHAFEAWFHHVLPGLLHEGLVETQLRTSWQCLLENKNMQISDYGSRIGSRLGTTAAALLIARERYHIVNIGDSRVYRIKEGIFQITKDQTYVQREMDLGRMTPEQAAKDPQRNVLLQCIGASSFLEPDFYDGVVGRGENYLLCSDGFRHLISLEELYRSLSPLVSNREKIMWEQLVSLTELNKSRREEDNISALLVHAC